MKVLVVSAFPPDPAPEANHALHVSEQLARAGHTVHVLCKEGSIAATTAGMVMHSVVKRWSWSDLPRLISCLRTYKPDVVLLLYLGWVYNHEPMITFLPTICRKILPGVDCVTQFESVDMDVPPRLFWNRVWRKAMALWVGGKVHYVFGTLLRDSAKIIALSSPHRHRLLSHCPDIEDKTVIIPPPPLVRISPVAPLMARKEVRHHIGAGESDFVLLYWGYIYPGKGIETLLRAFRIVCSRAKNARLVLVGGDLEVTDRRQSCVNYCAMVRQLPDTLGIADKVTWTGSFAWDSDAGSRYLYGGDLCILPLDWGVTLNNSSLAAASAHSLPVIGTELQVGRDEMLEHGKNIYLCPPRDPEILADAIHLIMNDAGFRERLRQGSRELARDWHCWESTTARLIDVLESAGGGGRRDHRMSPRAGGRIMGTVPPKIAHRVGSEHAPARQEHAVPLSLLPPPNHADAVSVPLVSIIVPVYNVETCLSQCLDSLVNQTLSNIEIIVVNDDSTDRSADVIAGYQGLYSNLLSITCASNKGLASARNTGLRAAKGRYVAFVDGDDWVDTRMCERLYQRAAQDSVQVVIADATVFYHDSKQFRPFFDQQVRQSLDPLLRTMPFKLDHEPRALLLEPVAWTKLYERAFLEKHAIRFEDGMNSYEDVCFHFSVLLKAERISLLDEQLFYYRQNRPGQISGCTSRKIFEVFDVFKKIHENLRKWDVSAPVWAMLIKVQLRQFHWLLSDRVTPGHQREFMASVAQQFRGIPGPGFRCFAQQATVDETLRLYCMRHNWLYAYEKLIHGQWSLLHRAGVLLRDGWGDALRRMGRHGRRIVRQRLVALLRLFVHTDSVADRLVADKGTVHGRLEQMTQEIALRETDHLIETCCIKNHVLFLSRPAYSGLREAVARVHSDYYLSQTAVFREGDVVVDVGAHVGAFSIYLGKRFPFLRIYAVEPDPANYACLVRNIELNRVPNVLAIHKAVSGDGTDKTLYVDASNSTDSTIDVTLIPAGRALRTAQIQSVTLAQLFQDHALTHCRLMKVTAPGVIDEVLRGFTLSGCVDFLCGETHLSDCGRVQLEAASWRIARQHFWRLIGAATPMAVHQWLHRMPRECEPRHHRLITSLPLSYGATPPL
jgi:polysaccharide biosynthesis protein PslF